MYISVQLLRLSSKLAIFAIVEVMADVDRPNQRLNLFTLIEAGIITPPLTLFGTFRGKHFSALVDQEGFVILDGRRLTSPSIAAGVVRARITGPPKDGLRYRRANGWTFWRYSDESGSLRSIDDLRKKYNVK